MKIHQVISERPKQQKTITVFHGTSSTFLPRIKKHGLLPDTGNHIYGMDDGLPALGGVYLTRDKHKAKDAAEVAVSVVDGKPIVLQVQYVLGSGGIDEDSVNISINKAIQHWNPEFDRSGKIKTQSQHQLARKINHQLPSETKKTQKSQQLAKKLLRTTVALLTAQAQELYLDQNFNNKQLLIAFDVEIVNDDTYIQQLLDLINSTKATKNVDDFRLTRPVKWRGKTRIVDVLDANNL